jgi:hypothetical protein
MNAAIIRSALQHHLLVPRDHRRFRSISAGRKMIFCPDSAGGWAAQPLEQQLPTRLLLPQSVRKLW